MDDTSLIKLLNHKYLATAEYHPLALAERINVSRETWIFLFKNRGLCYLLGSWLKVYSTDPSSVVKGLNYYKIPDIYINLIYLVGQIISIANQKGGVGKTTTAVNLCASLAAAEKSCLLVDCDPQGNATTGLGIDKSHLNNGLYEFMLGSAPEEKVIMETNLSGLYLIGATIDLIGAEVEMVSADKREYRLRRKLIPLREKYDYIFLDCPPSLGFLTLNALTAADSVLIPLQCEYYALEGLSQLLRTIRAVRNGLNPSLKMAGILLTMHDSRNNLSLQVEEEVREHFRGTVFKTIIPRNVRLSEAPSHGKPALLYDVKSRGAQSYLALAKELVRKGTGKNG